MKAKPAETPVRVRAMFFLVTEVVQAQPHPRRQISDRIAYGDLKLVLDGTPIERSAACAFPTRTRPIHAAS